MNIILMNHFPLHGSGSGTYTFNLAQSLSRLGHKVTVIFPENRVVNFTIPNVKLHPVYFDTVNVKIKDISSLPFSFPCFTTHPSSTLLFSDITDEELEYYISAFDSALQEEIAYQHPDFIHTGHLWIHGFVASKYDIPLITTIHGTDLIGYQKWPRFRKYANVCVKKSQKIIAISKNSEKLFLEIFKDFDVENKIELIPNGYNKDVFYLSNVKRKDVLSSLYIPTNFKKVVCFAGKLTNIKGVDILLKAAKIYEREDLVTIIAGDGILKNELLSLKQSLNLQNVYFIGNVDHHLLNQIYNISDVSLVPSRSEAFGLVAIEALACGTPVIATNVGGLSEIVKTEYGKLIEVDDYRALAFAVEDILSRKDDYDRKSISKKIENTYSQEVQVRKLIKVYHEVLRGKL